MKNGDALRQCIDRQEMVRRRWRLLAQALFAGGSVSCARRNNRTYDFLENLSNFFDLFDVHPQPQLAEPTASWYRYELKVDDGCKSVKIRHPTASFTIDQLVGFNNTGNVRVWPSEEVLAYLALKNEPFFAGKSVLEVGGGMSCLAGVLLAQHADCQSVQLTDGHPNAVQNVARIVEANAPNCAVGCEVLVWSEYRQHRRTYDVILAADCLFFDDSRADLLLLVEAVLRPTGVVLMVAPRRGQSLQKFVSCARRSGFRCSVRSHYDKAVWLRHNELKAQKSYDEDAHFPLLVVMTRMSNRVETDSLWQV
ncbi:hypothetical protein V9T40_012097 [Parthenolecanium corni]|uniref:Calmodulin-lysine N-methyltransferase n=1 Tax=Parthenolecanium corni TaxID=536013 RepID=A0AAN9TMI0_9HEMI